MTHRSLSVVALALVMLVAGCALSRTIEPGVRVETVTLPPRTPAVRFLPSSPGLHPRALLAHGVTASKETMFRFGEALAAAGFDCVAVDLAGHGASSRPFVPADNVEVLGEAVRALGGVDVFVGHSMGAYAGAASVRAGALRPALFVAVGALPDFGTGGPPLLLLSGRFEEAVSVEASGSARAVTSPWSDHALEPYDPVLVDAAVQAACSAHALAVPAPPTRWVWRLAGMGMALAGALLLADRLPALLPRLVPWRGLLVATLALGAFSITGTSWVGAAPVLPRIPWNVAGVALVGLVVCGAARLGMPRFTRWVIPLVVTLVSVVLGHPFLALLSGLFTLLCLLAHGVAWVAARGGAGTQGDVAFAVFVGYALGQWIPLM